MRHQNNGKGKDFINCKNDFINCKYNLQIQNIKQ